MLKDGSTDIEGGLLMTNVLGLKDIQVNSDGTTNTPHDYIVKQVATSLNSVSIAVSKVNVRG